MASLAAQLHAAARDGDLEGLQACLAACQGQIPALHDAESPLHAAARCGHAACVEALLAAGHDPNAASFGAFHLDRGWRPLHYAACTGHVACVTALLARGVEPEARTDSGITPLACAAEVGSAECVAALLVAGASPAAPDYGGWTAVHIPASRGHAHVLRLLLAAQPEAAWRATRDGRTPVDMALQSRQLEAARCLLQHGALQPASTVLALLARHVGVWRQPLYASLAARQSLTAAEWAHVPMPCAGLGAALPAVLGRSAAEASLLVRHLSPAGRECLHTAALCLARAQRVHSMPLPASVLGQVLALSMAG